MTTGKTTHTTTTASTILAELAELTSSKAWGLDKNKPRLYCTTQRGVTAYFDFPDWDGEELGGPKFVVYCTTENVSDKWKWNTIEGIRDYSSTSSLAIIAYMHGYKPLAREIIASGMTRKDEGYDALVSCIHNDRLEDAKLILDRFEDASGD